MKETSAGFIALTSALAIVLAGIWYVTPLGFGFARWPSDETIRRAIFAIYWATYFVGIPMLLISQVVSIILFALGLRKAAFFPPIISLGLFVSGAGVVLTFMNR